MTLSRKEYFASDLRSTTVGSILRRSESFVLFKGRNSQILQLERGRRCSQLPPHDCNESKRRLYPGLLPCPEYFQVIFDLPPLVSCKAAKIYSHITRSIYIIFNRWLNYRSDIGMVLSNLLSALVAFLE